jgi:NADH:ubiquinone oxidoreductase subunit 3 (subunit A)
MTAVASGTLVLLLCCCCCCCFAVEAMKHSFSVTNGKTLIGPVGTPFGYNQYGHFELEVRNFELKAKNKEILTQVEAGFYLRKFGNEAIFDQYMDLLQSNRSICSFAHLSSVNDYDSLDGSYDFKDDDSGEFDGYGEPEIISAEHGILLSMKSTKNWTYASIEYRFKEGEEGLYFLIFQVCPYYKGVTASFQLDFHFCNSDRYGNENHLPAGEMKLPLLYFFFAISYLLCFGIWYTNIQQINKGNPGHFAKPEERPVVYSIHQLMSLLLLLKFCSVLFESFRYHRIRVTGHAEVWTFLFYAINFVKGMFLFTVILLIGTGWSFVKPFISEREKKVIFAILILQVINNIAIIVVTNETEGEKGFSQWNGILHIVDILCCCAVLVPIVWQVNELEKSAGMEEDGVDLSERAASLESGDKGQILSKLKLFRTFYLVVVAYIYLTRILVYLFATMLDYRHIWVRDFVIEGVTLVFYVSVGFLFRPSGENYQKVASKGESSEEGVELLGRNGEKSN